MRQGVLAVSFALLLALLTGRPAESPFVVHHGAGFSVELPPGFAVAEAWDGEIYSLDVFRTSPGADREVPFVRFLNSPAESGPLDRFAFFVAERAADALSHRGLRVDAGEPVRLRIGGSENRMRRYPLSRGEAPAGALLAGVRRHRGQRIGAVVRLTGSPGEREIAERILAGAAVRPIGPETPLTVGAGPVAFRAPLVTRVEWFAGEGGGIAGRLGLPEGSVQVFVRDLRTAAAAAEALAGAPREYERTLAPWLERADARIVDRAPLLLPAGGRLAPGARGVLALAGEKIRDVVLVPIRIRSVLVTFVAFTDESHRDAMAARLACLVGSLNSDGEPHVLPAASLPFTPAGRDLVFAFTADAGEIRFTARRSPVPAAEVPPPETFNRFPATLFGREILAAEERHRGPDGRERVRFTARAVEDDGEVAATLTGPAASAAELRLAFGWLAGRLAPGAAGGLSLDAAPSPDGSLTAIRRAPPPTPGHPLVSPR